MMRHHIRSLTGVLLSVCMLFSFPGCIRIGSGTQSSSVMKSESAGESESAQSLSESASSSVLSSAQAKLNSMSLEEKVGQMFMLAFRKDGSGNNLTALDAPSVQALKAIMPGGIILFDENVGTLDSVRSFISSAQDGADIPLFVTADEEGGSVQRLKSAGATDLPAMRKVGSTKDTSIAQKVGNVLGTELSVFGFNMDCAPVCDVNSNPKNPVTGDRAFSNDPQVVSDMSLVLSKGLRETGVIPVVKHFPGHGDTDADTHTGYAILNKTLAELEQTELVPFKAQIDSGAPVVMVSHISLPKINKDYYPASMSENIVTGLLREQLGFKGVIITDAMSMGAIVKNYDSTAACVQAVKAGVDILLMPEEPLKAYNAVLSAVKSGSVPESRINESVLRILNLKYEYGLFSGKALPSASLLGCAGHRAVVDEINAKQP